MYNASVRCGNLTAGRSMNPEFLAGLCGPKRLPAVGLPSQGPAPLSAWGFSLVNRFCGGLWAGSDADLCRSATEATTKPIPDPQSGLAVGCFWIGRLRKRVCRLWPELTGPNPEASLGPEWAALKKHKEERLSTRLSSDPFFFLSFGLSSLDGWTPLKGVWGFVGSVSFFFQ